MDGGFELGSAPVDQIVTDVVMRSARTLAIFRGKLRPCRTGQELVGDFQLASPGAGGRTEASTKPRSRTGAPGNGEPTSWPRSVAHANARPARPGGAGFRSGPGGA